MGIAYSPPDKVIHYDIDASSSECLRAGLHAAVTKAGWTVHETLENGYVYILTSPQDETLQCKVRIEDTGRHVNHFPRALGPNCIDVTFLSASEAFESQPFAIGYRTPEMAALYGEPPRRIRVHVTPCQIFTYLPGVPDLPAGNAVMGGIPYIDPNALETGEHCADEDNELKTTQAFWACGDQATSFRDNWVAFWNATLHNTAFATQEIPYGNGDLSRLRLLPPNKTVQFFYALGNINFWYPVMMRWMGTEDPLCLDPLIAWNTSHPVRVRGQLWDALIRTKHAPAESPLLFDELPFFNYSCIRQQGYPAPHWYQSTDIASLYLRDPGVTRIECGHEEEEPIPSLSNYAY